MINSRAAWAMYQDTVSAEKIERLVDWMMETRSSTDKDAEQFSLSNVSLILIQSSVLN